MLSRGRLLLSTSFQMKPHYYFYWLRMVSAPLSKMRVPAQRQFLSPTINRAKSRKLRSVRISSGAHSLHFSEFLFKFLEQVWCFSAIRSVGPVSTYFTTSNSKYSSLPRKIVDK